MEIQWLLIGGPRDGQTVWIVQGDHVTVDGVVYQGQNYLDNGRLYRVGFLNPNDLLPSRVRYLIHKTGVQQLAGS